MNKTILKWAGSKVRIMNILKEQLPAGRRLVEPFAGSCAVMMNTDYSRYLVADVNPDLINLYKVIKQIPDCFISIASAFFENNNTSDDYYDIRARFNARNESLLNMAAMFLYLNRHGFNGLCRYNRNGEFNVPYGRYKKTYFPEAEIRAFAKKAKRAKFVCCSYEESLQLLKDGDVIYCDPPYLAASNTADFTSYHSSAFGYTQHERLASMLRECALKGYSSVISNSSNEYAQDLYKDFETVTFEVRRSIGAAASAKKNALEILATLQGVKGVRSYWHELYYRGHASSIGVAV